MTILRTVLGDVPAERSGMILTHEHLLYGYPGAETDHRTVLDYDATIDMISAQVSRGMSEFGYGTMVDMTPPEVGRHPQLMADVARRTGMNVIAITGFFPERMGIPYYWRRQTVEELTDFFVRDLTEGMVFAWQQTPYKAGVIKIATGQESVEPKPSPIGPNGRRIHYYEDRVIRAAGRASARVGCAVNTHTDPMDYDVTNPGIEQLDILEEEGADPSRVIIGHAFVNPDPVQLRDICRRGANLQLDHIGIPWRVDTAEELDEMMADALVGLVEDGYGDQLVLSYDRWFFNPRSDVTESDPQLANEKVDIGYMFTSFIPRLKKKGLTDEQVSRMLIDNPRRILAIPA
ncbi:phosphotriesterase family protein [Sphaerisporangium aureirubrum]|uniref:Phosphotriesterase n=1 Tax=Sphaerisporangium aureirubrum TaxID=1544736 RepID=A0ABW1NTT7_9ACTN